MAFVEVWPGVGVLLESSASCVDVWFGRQLAPWHVERESLSSNATIDSDDQAMGTDSTTTTTTITTTSSTVEVSPEGFEQVSNLKRFTL